VLERITPVFLTKNEAPNIERGLNRLTWAHDIVVVDSYSTDATLSLLSCHPRVRVFQRAFDSHAKQWDFALKRTSIETEWVLALDADYVLSDELVRELALLKPSPDVAGYRASFRYAVHGKALRQSTYPPVTVLFRRDRAGYVQDGHTQRVVLDGYVHSLRGRITHDDRKSLASWVESQQRYMRLEARKLSRTHWRQLPWQDRVRKLPFMAPVAMAVHCLFVKRAILDGRAGIYYALQRVFSEVLLGLYLIEEKQQPLPETDTRGAEAMEYR
jgi:hypothetical protein